jgi:putative multiple sugar transport system substrate-binding protein
MVVKKTAAALAGVALVFSALTACSSSKQDEGTQTDTSTDSADTGGQAGGPLVGVTMPTKSLERWNNDGAQLIKLLEDAGYTTQLDYADNKPEQQISQLENQINAGAKLLVIASIDGESLGPTLQKAKEASIPVVAYDRLLMKTPDVDYYATFDNYLVGKLQGEFIVDALDLETAAGPFNLEPFAGSPDDNNAGLFFAGAWDVLMPYVESGKLTVPSGKGPASAEDWRGIGIQAWKSETAQAEMENRLNSFYTDKKVDVVLSPNDSLAMGIAMALEANGYQVGADWPILTGQDGDKANVKNIVDGKQSMTVWKDTRKLADDAARMADEILKGTEVTTNDTTTYDNGVKVVPSYLEVPQVVTKDEVQSLLIDSGFITEADIQ